MIIGYARTSTVEQIAGMESQIKELEAAGCTKIYNEQISSVAQRAELKKGIEFSREGDIFVVTKIDRLARSVRDLMNIIAELEKKKVSLRILNLGMDTSTPTGSFMLVILGAVAQLEREMMLERQREGIAKAKAEGKYRGRKPLPFEVKNEVIKLINEGVSKRRVAKRMNLGEATIYRILKTKSP